MGRGPGPVGGDQQRVSAASATPRTQALWPGRVAPFVAPAQPAALEPDAGRLPLRCFAAYYLRAQKRENPLDKRAFVL